MGASASWVEQIWYRGHPAYRLLLPLSLLFAALSGLRRLLYRWRILRSQRLPVPVIVVGNISVGGVGKTPVVIDLVRRLREAGWSPGVVSRGYGGTVRRPTPVGEQSDPAEVGDEPVMIATATGCPVAVAPERVAAARLLLTQGVNIIVADDGLQHYALQRDYEIVVVDGQRRHGNGQLLPAGPLRERAWRLDGVDLVVVNGTEARAGEYALVASMGPAEHLLSGRQQALQDFSRVHAVAGIGEPEKFFRALEQQGLDVVRHGFADHHRFVMKDLNWPGNEPVLMTWKDAVKCRSFRDPRFWAVHFSAALPESAWQQIRARFTPPVHPTQSE